MSPDFVAVPSNTTYDRDINGLCSRYLSFGVPGTGVSSSLVARCSADVMLYTDITPGYPGTLRIQEVVYVNCWFNL